MKYKLLKGAAHNIGHSFVGGMNWDKNRTPIISLIGNRVLETGQSQLEINLMSGKVTPVTLATPDSVKDSIARYVGGFPKFLESHKVSIKVLSSAVLTVRFFPEKLRTYKGSRQVELPYQCEVKFIDDMGRTHLGKVKDDISFFALPHPLVRWFKQVIKRKA